MIHEPEIEKTRQLLTALCRANKDIHGGALISENGRVLTHTFGEERFSRRVGMVVGALLNLFQFQHDTLRIGTFRELLLEGNGRSALVYGIGKVMLLLVLRKDANIGLVSLEGGKTAKEISYEFLDF